MTPIVPTAEFGSIVHGRTGVALDDPAEAFHEASRLYPNVVPPYVGALATLGRSVELQQSTLRASRTHDHRDGVALEPIRLPRRRFRDLVDERRSELPPGRRPVALGAVATLLGTAYRSRARGGSPLRPVPSAGALYPLDLYLLPLAVRGLAASALHYHPFDHRLERLHAFTHADARAALVDPSLADRASLLVVVTTMVWRSRFKYGLRGYRFALLEAGHVAQNLLLAATALRLPAVPVGGFYDRRVDDLVGADGLDEAAIYVICIGGPS